MISSILHRSSVVLPPVRVYPFPSSSARLRIAAEKTSLIAIGRGRVKQRARIPPDEAIAKGRTIEPSRRKPPAPAGERTLLSDRAIVVGQTTGTERYIEIGRGISLSWIRVTRRVPGQTCGWLRQTLGCYTRAVSPDTRDPDSVT